MGVVQFFVSSGSTQPDACSSYPFMYVYADDVNCGGCLPAVGCWPCLNTTQQLFYDSGLTQPVADGYYANEWTPGLYNTWYVIGGFLQSGGFNSCPSVPPPPTPT